MEQISTSLPSLPLSLCLLFGLFLSPWVWGTAGGALSNVSRYPSSDLGPSVIFREAEGLPLRCSHRYRPESQVPTDVNVILRTLSLTQGGEIFRSSGIDCDPAVAVRNLLNLTRNCHVSSLIPSYVIHWVFNREYSYIFKMNLFILCEHVYVCA